MDPVPRGDGWKTTWSDCKPGQTAPLGDELELRPCDRGLAYPLGPRTKLYRSSHVVALVSASLALLVLFSLLWTFGLPRIAGSNRWVGFGVSEETLRKQDRFLIGVGKADITGYGGNFLY
jgi:hypothetical protein